MFSYHDINNAYLNGVVRDKYPIYDFWWNNPLSSQSIINPRSSGLQSLSGKKINNQGRTSFRGS